MALQLVVLDAETYWADDYTLSKLTNEEYIRDPRFKVHGWGVKPVGAKPHWLREEQLLQWAEKADWDNIGIICQNTRFDGAILGWKYGIKPRLWIDTMGMFRALYPALKSHSLASLGKEFGFGVKGHAVMSTKNKRDLNPAEWDILGDYCAYGADSDCRITERLFLHGWPSFPPFERAIMDMTLRMFIYPTLEVDGPVLTDFLATHMREKAELLEKCGLDKKSVMSNAKFAEALERIGVEPPMKPSPSNPDRRVFAFAKTDAAMDELLEHEDARVQVLAAARVGNKSTQLETRAKRLIGISERGALPIPLNYWGAKITGRHSGGDGLNMQNFTRGSVLRDGVKAPPGFKIVVGDSSNIELRLVMALAGQLDQIEKIRYYDSIPENERVTDLYCDFASAIYGRNVTKADTDERFVGKQGMLSLQYMASGKKFGNMLRQKRHPIPEAEAERVKDVYRAKHYKVKQFWYYCENEVIPAIHAREVMRPVDVNGWFLTTQNGFALPGELGVQYPSLAYGALHIASIAGTNTILEKQWFYDSGRGRRNLYGAKVVENLCQHAARQVVMYQGLLVATRYPLVHSVHDELVCCVPDEEAEECAAFMLQCLSTAPKWTQGKLPVTGEVGIGDSYGEAK